jgi:hypothetical protein
MAIIKDPNNPRTVQLTGEDLQSYLNNRKPIIQAEEQAKPDTERTPEEITNYLKTSEEFKDFDVMCYLSTDDIEGVNSFDDLYSILDDGGFFHEREIIYYSKAIKYLQENDPSLSEALAIAHEMGYEVKNLNSELLATLLYQQNFREEFCDLEEDFNDFLDTI